MDFDESQLAEDKRHTYAFSSPISAEAVFPNKLIQVSRNTFRRKFH